ncbi:hypothetical protein [Streptomyces dysideae]|uniref:hypothetical protein n=1 Tax=Streptomyces dysideae TaxID=909626 RepID=UPI000A97ADC5|nr:hypothetical protein [Streptomyces dysideae]
MDQDAGRGLLEWLNQWRDRDPEAAQRAAGVRQKAKASGHSRITQVGGNQTIIRPERLRCRLGLCPG